MIFLHLLTAGSDGKAVFSFTSHDGEKQRRKKFGHSTRKVFSWQRDFFFLL